MYKPDKATTERNAKILRELVKQPDNKLCADCKRNDPRWASWNLGVFLCIRCSGVHRGMGTHISRVKSIDLDMWTPEQMESIQKWGNRRANLYWEAHLKAGHVPPDHKMESYIRSKYESRRWAMEGPPPSDPSTLERPAQSSSNHGNAAATKTATATAAAPLFDGSPAPATPARRAQAHAPTRSLSLPNPTSPTTSTATSTSTSTLTTSRHQPTQSRQLLSTAVAGRSNAQGPSPTTAQPQAKAQAQQRQQQQPQQQQQGAMNDLFSLDFHAPPTTKPTTAPPPPSKDVKQDILSLFSSTPTPTASTQAQPQSATAFGQFTSASSSWDAFGAQPQTQTQMKAQPVSMMGNNGTGLWGVSSGWNGPIPNATPSSDLWGAPTITNATPSSATAPSASGVNALNAFNTTDIWGGSGPSASASATNSLFGSQATAPPPKKDDVFGDLWGDFK